eukprot:TRINITY_DN11914_c0_g1_i1.p1 TRINITY_DN11914_c0_g1~~TRINITY_DN11914_c0_g1_i1.p1  ORF type:complete len:300 (+),score=74.16 TRINITY_DN11914_c0_g1_i1:538-1437(+)
MSNILNLNCKNTKCTNNRKDNPTKFRNQNQNCDDCLAKRRQIRLLKYESEPSKCVSCDNNRDDHFHKFNRGNKQCTDCISKKKCSLCKINNIYKIKLCKLCYNEKMLNGQRFLNKKVNGKQAIQTKNTKIRNEIIKCTQCSLSKKDNPSKFKMNNNKCDNCSLIQSPVPIIPPQNKNELNINSSNLPQKRAKIEKNEISNNPSNFENLFLPYGASNINEFSSNEFQDNILYNHHSMPNLVEDLKDHHFEEVILTPPNNNLLEQNTIKNRSLNVSLQEINENLLFLEDPNFFDLMKNDDK